MDLSELKSIRKLKEAYLKISGDNSFVRTSKMRRLVTQNIRQRWLSDSYHSLFWSNLVFGTNRIMRILENSHADRNTTKKLSCVFIDCGWIASQIGDHMARLCASTSVRLISIRPAGALATLISTTFKPMKQLITAAVRLPSGSCSDLQKFLDFVNNKVPLLGNSDHHLTKPSNKPADHFQTDRAGSKRKNDALVLEVQTKRLCLSTNIKDDILSQDKSLEKPFDTGTTESSWSDVILEPSELYIFKPTSKWPVERICNLSDLWFEMAQINQANSYRSISLHGPCIDPQEVTLPTYKEPSVKSVKPRSTVERRSKKKKKQKQKKIN